MTITVDQIADMAEQACFYVTPGGHWLRIQYCNMDEGYLSGMDEDDGEEYNIPFDEITLADGECFHMLVKMKVPTE
jgi:hypothetical protein